MNNEEISEEAQAEMAREAGLPRIVSMRSRCSSISGAMSSLTGLSGQDKQACCYSDARYSLA
jgi:hypothetical protein